jgi:hypothetical protein
VTARSARIARVADRHDAQMPPSPVQAAEPRAISPPIDEQSRPRPVTQRRFSWEMWVVLLIVLAAIGNAARLLAELLH